MSTWNGQTPPTFERARYPLAFPLFLFISISACSDPKPDIRDNEAASRVDNFECTRDPDVLLGLLANSQTCVTTDECPMGSHCDAVQHVCTWDCISDSDCGSTGACDCAGLCTTSGGGGVDGGVPPDPTCPRDQAVLLGMNTPAAVCDDLMPCPAGQTCNPVTTMCDAPTCRHDDQCPAGSHCDATERCSFTCLPDATAGSPEACNTGEVCSCGGECVPAGSVPLVDTSDAANMSVSVDRITVGAGDPFPEQTFTLRLEALRAAQFTDAAKAPVVTVVAGDGINVAVGVDPGAPKIQISSWTPVAVDGRYVATVEVRVIGTVGAPLPGHIELRGERSSPRYQRLAVDRDVPTPRELWDALDGHYQDSSAGLDAWIRNGHVYLFESDLLGAATSRTVAFALRNDATPSFPPTTKAGHRLEIDDASPPADPVAMVVHRGGGTAGTVSESLSFSHVGDITAAACLTTADCGANAYCELGIAACVVGEDFRLPKVSSPLEGDAPDLVTLPRLGNETAVQIRAERLFCYDLAQSEQPYTDSGLDHTTGVLTASGDLRCKDGGTPRTFRLIAEAEERGDAANTPAVLAPICVDGFVPKGTGGYFNLLSNYSDPQQAAGWFVHSESNACIAPERALGALALLGAKDYRAISSARLLNHVITRWADTLSFAAMQGAQLTLADRTLELVPTLSANSTARLVDALHLMLDKSAGLDSTIAPEALREPDYRTDRPIAFWSFDLPDGEVSPGDGMGVPPIAYDLVGDRDLVFETDVVAQNDDYGVYFSLPGSPGTPEPSLSNVVRDIPLPGDFTIAVAVKRPPVGFMQLYSSGNFSIYLQDRTGTTDPDDSLLTVGWQTATGWQATSYARLNHPWIMHIAIVRRGGTVEIYDDGIQVVSTFLGLPAAQEATNQYSSGFRAEVAHYINNLAIWDRALDSELITRHYDSTGFYDNMSVNLAGFPVAATDRQATGYPVAMVEAASQVVRLAELGLSHAMLRNFAACSASIVSDEMRTAENAIFVARRTLAAMRKHVDRASLTLAVQGLACPGGSTPGTYNGTQVCMSGGAPLRTTIPWQSSYDRAVTELESALRSAQDTWGRARLCENPLGIPTGWVPTYFGDVSGESSKFLASSDYLMEHWALPHVSAARTSFANAQNAYVQQRQSVIQQTLTDQDADRRIEAIELRYGEELKQLCGIESMDATDVLDGFAPGGQLLIEHCGLAELCQNDTPLTASCFVGDVGRAMQGIRHVQAESRRAASRAMERWTEAWDQQTYCVQQEALLGTQTAALAELIDYREEYRDVYEDDGSLAGGVFDTVQDMTRTFTSLLRFDLDGAFNAVKDVGGADDIREEIREMEDAYTLLQQQTSDYLQNQRCWLEFDRMFHAAMDAVRAISSLRGEEATRWIELHNLVRRVGNAIDDGLTARDRELGRGRVDVAFHYWLDEHLDNYHRDLALAQKYAYLAMRAAEHELQQSFGLDGQILGATTPSRLENALAIVDQYRFTRGINGRRPSEDIIVMSMRDQLLKLEDGPAALIDKGYRAITAEERFGKRLISPHFALYDRNGRYLGQALRFVVPAEYELTHRCAERLWRVTATVQGDGLDIGAPTIPMVMLKSNSFASQWCEDHGTGDDDGFQNAWSGPLVALGHAESSDNSNDFTPASISAWLNVRRSDLYRDQYTEGASEELAGRGLYGEYVLLFPQAGLFDRPGDPLPLEMVEDVLVRFDYVSISDLQPQLRSQGGHDPAPGSL